MTNISTKRRALLRTAGSLLVAPALVRPAAAQSVPFSTGTEKPKLNAPPNLKAPLILAGHWMK
jgi:hypothetical protein